MNQTLANLTTHSQPKRPLSGPCLTLVSLNIEGLTPEKEQLISEIVREYKCEVLCLQETHRGVEHKRPNIKGMSLIIERPHKKYGSALFVKHNTQVKSAAMSCTKDIEILSVDLGKITIASVYKPPGADFIFTEPDNFRDNRTKIIIGDFNSHNVNWGYNETNEDGEKVEEWAEANGFSLIFDAKLPASFNSGRWKRGYNPDNIFTSENIATLCKKEVLTPIPKTQHRPIACEIRAAINPITVPFQRRFNFKKARWSEFSEALDIEIKQIQPAPHQYETFVEVVKKISRKYIPRGCRTEYIPGMKKNLTDKLYKYGESFKNHPFELETEVLGEELMEDIANERKKEWQKTMEGMDMKQNSSKAWRLIRKLNCEKRSKYQYTNITADEVAHQILINGKAKRLKGKQNNKITRCTQHLENNYMKEPFNSGELANAINKMKSGKAAGPDYIRTEQLKNFGPAAHEWLLQFYNECTKQMRIPKIWHKSQIIAILKPGKPPIEAKNYRPVALLCHAYKVYERLILNRITAEIDKSLIKEQAGFRPGKCCTGQVLHLTQHIEDGYEEKKITGAVFVDLSAAYDTVNHKRLKLKIYNLTKDYKLANMVNMLLSNRRFYVSLQGKRSRWRNQRNGLPQGSVLAPTLFNIYTNDQPISPNTKHFLYADDVAITAQCTTFEQAEEYLNKALEDLSTYYAENQLKPNPSKTQSCSFHLKNRQAKRKLQVKWEGVTLNHTPHPKYLGVTLDRSLTYREHCINTKAKVNTRNNLLKKLVHTNWGAEPTVLRTTALALCHSAAEYACPVWMSSTHAKKVDVAVNETCRIITGCLKPTNTNKLYTLCGIAPPEIRRQVIAEEERKKCNSDEKHLLYGYKPQNNRLKSRHSFLHRTTGTLQSKTDERILRWKDRCKADEPIWTRATENLPPGRNLKYGLWKTLNRLRVEVGRTKKNLVRWKIGETVECECGDVQDDQHLLQCVMTNTKCERDDLFKEPNDEVIKLIQYWLKRGI